MSEPRSVVDSLYRTRPYDEKKDKERIEEAAKEKEFANGKPDLPMSNEKDNKAYDMEMTYL